MKTVLQILIEPSELTLMRNGGLRMEIAGQEVMLTTPNHTPNRKTAVKPRRKKRHWTQLPKNRKKLLAMNKASARARRSA